ncbi:AAA family ATPase [Polaribacter septentrionalilitoris]|uniref:AAA family ATPase n=1 Tax=Polaribacter septentrionalilitoris TaxID=2494657 RepID=UPI00135860B3|nr:AAA family ATPase [Polaribacter septentrionalilitoris]
MTKKIKEINLGDIPEDFDWNDIDDIVFTSARPPKGMEEITQRINNSHIESENLGHIGPPDELKSVTSKINKEYAKNDLFIERIKNNKESTTQKNVILLNEKYSVEDDKDLYNAFELFNLNIKEVPKLVEPFFQQVGLASLVGTSDAGKSTFLRQLALSIVLQKENFLDFKLNITHGKVIYVSTEDGVHSIGNSIKKQIASIKKDKEELSLLKNLKFIFDTDKLYLKLTKLLSKEPADLIVIDAFTDVFTKELNSNTQVRSFLNHYDNLAKKNNCLIIFLHHTGKRTQHNSPTKDSILGSQGFEAKMRSVVELKPNKKNSQQKDLWILKSNFLEASEKKKSYLLNFSSDMVFSNSGNRGSTSIKAKSNNIELLNKVLELHKQGKSYRKIEEELKGTKLEVSKSVANELVKQHKKGGN